MAYNHHAIYSSSPFKSRRSPPRGKLEITADILSSLVFEDQLITPRGKEFVHCYNKLKEIMQESSS